LRRPAERSGHQGKVLGEELILQGPGAGRDEHARTGQQCRHEVCEGLSGTCAGLDREQFTALQRRGNALSHAALLPAHPEVRQSALERPSCPEYVDQIVHARRVR
jgi:hypothetical protein